MRHDHDRSVLAYGKTYAVGIQVTTQGANIKIKTMATFDIKDAPFIGKFTFSDFDLCRIYLNKQNYLSYETNQGDYDNAFFGFNLYGDLANGFVIQAANRLYLSYHRPPGKM